MSVKKLEKQPHGGALARWPKGVSGNPRGNPKRFYNKLKEGGYSNGDIENTMRNLMGRTREELARLYQDERVAAFERTIAKVIYDHLVRGKLNDYHLILDKIGMKSTEAPSANATVTVTVAQEMTDPVTLSQYYQDLMSKK